MVKEMEKSMEDGKIKPARQALFFRLPCCILFEQRKYPGDAKDCYESIATERWRRLFRGAGLISFPVRSAISPNLPCSVGWAKCLPVSRGRDQARTVHYVLSCDYLCCGVHPGV